MDKGAGEIVADWLRRQAVSIHDCVEQWLKNIGTDLARAGSWGTDSCRRLIEYTAGGKMLRGGACAVGVSPGVCDTYRCPPHRLGQRTAQCPVCRRFAGAVAAFLLIHDDIMDRDDLRRGAVSMHAQYTRDAVAHGLHTNADHFGNSLAICLGDIAHACAVELMVCAVRHCDCTIEAGAHLLEGYMREIALVGIAQMDDIAYGMGVGSPNVEQVLRLYRFKTGRYTFALPLSIGARLAHADRHFIDTLEQIGEGLGIIFQMRDDWIGLFGESGTKPVGSDIGENKKTIYRQLLFATVSNTERNRLTPLFGAGSLTDVQLEYVRATIRNSGVEDRVQAMLDERAEYIVRLVDALEIGTIPPGPDRSAHESISPVMLLRALIEYSGSRTS